MVVQDNTYTGACPERSRRVYGLDLISGTDAGGNQNYYMYNGQGSVANIVDYNGTEKARYLYDAFGNTRYELELTPNVWKYTGEQQDDGTGFYYLRARYYDPFLGRFLSKDPAEAGHPYAYVENNPVNFVDPYGLDACKDVLGWTGLDDCDEVKDWSEEAAEDVVGGVAGSTRCIGNGFGCVSELLCGKEGGFGCVRDTWAVLQGVGAFLDNFLTPECLGFALDLTGSAAITVGGPFGYPLAALAFAGSLGIDAKEDDLGGVGLDVLGEHVAPFSLQEFKTYAPRFSNLAGRVGYLPTLYSAATCIESAF